jgi:hypothetical protein
MRTSSIDEVIMKVSSTPKTRSFSTFPRFAGEENPSPVGVPGGKPVVV